MQNIITHKDFEYAFDINKCYECDGNCCIGESGYIWVSPKEIKDMAKFLDIEDQEFKNSFLRKVGYRFSLKEIKKNSSYECIFFNSVEKKCSIYSVRPNQCRTFPFWDYFKTNIKEVKKECPGII